MAPAFVSAVPASAHLFGVGPAYHFVLRQRLPLGSMRSGWQPWLSTMATNIAIVILVTIMILLVGVGPFLLVHLPITFLGASIGVWLFYVQHQFEDTFWTHDSGWNFHEFALRGSSHYDLPPILRWFTANIGVHHVHHLCSRIPYYRLPRVLRAHPHSLPSGVLPYWKASSVYGWFFGTRVGSAESFLRLARHSSGAKRAPLLSTCVHCPLDTCNFRVLQGI